MLDRLDPRHVEPRRSARESNALLAGRTVCLVTVVLLLRLTFIGRNTTEMALFTVALSAEAITVVVHARAGDAGRTRVVRTRRRR